MQMRRALHFLKRQSGYLLFLLALGFATIEIGTRLIYPDRYLPYSKLAAEVNLFFVDGQASPSWGLFAPSDLYAHRLKPDLDIQIEGGAHDLSFRVRTDRNGWRAPAPPERKATSRPAVMVFGDSVTFGHGVEDNETYPAYLRGLLPETVDVMNFGVGGWGFAQYYLAWRDHRHRAQRRLVVIGAFPHNDFANLADAEWAGKLDGELPRPPLRNEHYFGGDGHMRRRKPYYYRIPVLRESEAFVFLNKALIGPAIDRLHAIYARLIGAPDAEEIAYRIIARIAKEETLPVIVAFFPARYTYAQKRLFFDDFIQRIGEMDNVVVVNFYPTFRENYGSMYIDPSHFTAAGNRIVAEKIAETILARPEHAKLFE